MNACPRARNEPKIPSPRNDMTRDPVPRQQTLTRRRLTRRREGLQKPVEIPIYRNGNVFESIF
jgi:hypothetical protein